MRGITVISTASWSDTWSLVGGVEGSAGRRGLSIADEVRGAGSRALALLTRLSDGYVERAPPRACPVMRFRMADGAPARAAPAGDHLDARRVGLLPNRLGGRAACLGSLRGGHAGRDCGRGRRPRDRDGGRGGLQM